MEISYLDVIDDYVGLTEIGDIDSIVDRLKLLPSKRMAEFCALLWKALPRPSKSNAPHRFVGNSAVSGLPHPCSGLDCRGKNISSVANFAAIYANEVVLFNPFRGLARSANHKERSKLPERLIRDVAFHVAEIVTLRPLIDRKICTFEDEETEQYCKNCTEMALQILTTGSSDQLPDHGLYFDLVDHYSKNSTVTYEGQRGRDSIFYIVSNEDLAGHERSYYYRNMGNKFNKPKKNTILSKAEILSIGMPENFAHFAGNDLVGGLLAMI